MILAVENAKFLGFIRTSNMFQPIRYHFPISAEEFKIKCINNMRNFYKSGDG